jgi:hypothetical protein
VRHAFHKCTKARNEGTRASYRATPRRAYPLGGLLDAPPPSNPQLYDRLIKKNGELRVEGALKNVPGYEDAVLIPSRATVKSVTASADAEAADKAEATTSRAILTHGLARMTFAPFWAAMVALGGAGVQKMHQDTGLTFDGFVGLLTSFHVVTPRPPDESTEFLCYRCSCKYYQRCGKCKHVLRESIRAKPNFVPPDRMLNMIGIVAKPGRKAKTKKALERQPGEGDPVLNFFWNLAAPALPAAAAAQPDEEDSDEEDEAWGKPVYSEE